MGTDTEPVRIRPSLSGYRRTVLTRTQAAFTVIYALGLGVLAVTGDGGFVILVVGSLVLVVALPLAVLWLVARVWTTDRAVHHRGPLGLTRVVPREAVASVLWLPGFHPSGNPPTGLLVLLDAQRRPLLRLEGMWWGPERLAALAPAVGAPVAVDESDLTPGQMAWRRLYEMPWLHRHPGALAAVWVVAVLAVVFAGSAIFDPWL